MAEQHPLSYEGFDYEAFWKDPERRHLDRLERWVVASLLPAGGRRILDAGGGYGRMAPTYIGRFDQSVLFDGALSLLEQARDRWADRITYVAGDLRSLPFTQGAFDAATMIRVVHHLEHPDEVLQGLRRSIRTGGTLVLSISNKRNLKKLTQFAMGRGPNPLKPGIVRYGPLSWGMHPDDAERLLVRAGFDRPLWKGVGITDKLAGRMGRLERYAPSGKGLAGPLGKLAIAPAMIGSARAEGAGPTTAAATLFECPRCRGVLEEEPGGHTCTACGAKYPVKAGIHDFRL
jgi:SAM-dependent methyltransferase